jgi:hypothetical protein
MMSKPEPSTEEDHLDDLPPFMGTWNRMYILVLVVHVVFISIFYLITLLLS